MEHEIEHCSYERQEINKEPGIHKGVTARQMEEMQDQIEELQTDVQVEIEKNPEAQKTISKLSPENSTLKIKNDIQKKSEIIISQNERIEKLNESDLVLRKTRNWGRRI